MSCFFRPVTQEPVCVSSDVFLVSTECIGGKYASKSGFHKYDIGVSNELDFTAKKEGSAIFPEGFLCKGMSIKNACKKHKKYVKWVIDPWLTVCGARCPLMRSCSVPEVHFSSSLNRNRMATRFHDLLNITPNPCPSRYMFSILIV